MLAAIAVSAARVHHASDLQRPTATAAAGDPAAHAAAYRHRLAERLGFFPAPSDARPLLWVHAVSLGETLAARPLIERLLAQMPDYQLAVTTTTPTGSSQVQKLFGERVFHVYAPWDTPGAVRRTLRRLQPRLLLIMETELWPNLLHHARRGGCRVVLANARLSARSAAGYARFAGLTRRMLDQLDLIAAQGEDSAQRFRGLGAAPERVRVLGSVKYDLAIDAGVRQAADELARRWALAARPVVVAASTHEPEERLLLEAFRASPRSAASPDGARCAAPPRRRRQRLRISCCWIPSVNCCCFTDSATSP